MMPPTTPAATYRQARSIGFTDPLSGQEREFTSGLELQERPR